MNKEVCNVNNVLFVCHGNICRSPMAEFLFRDMVEKRGLGDKILVASAGTSAEEMGNPPHPKTQKKLRDNGIIVKGKQARQLTREDYDRYDYILGMDEYNIRNMRRLFREDPDNKVYRLLDLTNSTRDIADPWYTGDYDQAYEDIYEGCIALLDKILKELMQG